MRRSELAELARTAERKPKGRRRAEPAASLILRDGRAAGKDASIAVEAPVALAYNDTPHVVMMASPGDLPDFALGFSLSEGILAGAEEMLGMAIEEGEIGIRIAMTIPRGRFAVLQKRRRNLAGRTGCGLCGVDDLTQIVRPIPPVASGISIDEGAIHRALEALPDHQVLNRQTGAVHAAGWADPTGALVIVREDVGRHNALDKLIGAMAREAIDPQRGFAVITSRCSFEMVQKTASFGIPILVAISAPTTMALRIARECDMTLVALARSDSVTLYANPRRVRGLAGEDAR